MKSISLFSAVILLVAGCATSKPVESELLALDLSYTLHTSHNGKLHHSYKEEGLVLIFPAIPGSIFGNPTDDVLSVSNAANGIFRLSLPQKLDGKAQSLADRRLEIRPSETKILRAGTFHAYPSYDYDVGGGGFQSITTGHALILVYFSNAATLEGSFSSGQETYHHEITVSQPGWNWIEVIEKSPGNYTLTLFEGEVSDIAFTVYLQGVVDA